MLRVFCMALMNAIPLPRHVFGATFATNAGYGVGLTTTNYLWISVAGNIVAVILIPFVGNLSDQIGRRPVIIVGCLGSGILAYPYLYFVSQGNLVMAFIFAILMWGIVYQGYNAVFPSFYQELFPTKTRVTGFAVSQNLGTLITAFLPAIYAALVGPPRPALRGGKEVPAGHAVAIGRNLPGGGRCCIETSGHPGRSARITLGLAIIAAIAAFSARETFRIHMNDLGKKDAVPVPKEEYDRIRKTGVDTPV